MFSLEEVVCKCTSASTNSENQGDEETRLGMSLYFEFQGSNEFLDRFDPKLRPSLYEGAANDAQQDFTGHLPKRKFALASPLEWPYVGLGYSATIHADLEFSDAIEIEDCKVDKFKFTINDEGATGFKFRVYFHPDLDLVGPLCALEKHELTLSLTPPDVQPVPESQKAEESPQGDLLADDIDGSAETLAIYNKAIAVVRATGNPTTSALQTELKISFNDAAVILSRLLDDGVIEKGDRDGEYVVVESAAA
jgi:DNA translocase FtsK/SpoIIIE-like protein